MTVAAALPADEAQRLARLQALAVLDSEAEPLFDSFTRLAAQVAGTPIALVSLIDQDRQWFKAHVGLPGVTQTPRDVAFCAHAILEAELTEVADATRDERFANNPLVTGDPRIRFYAGAPLTMPGGERLGTLCVIDRQPRQLTSVQREQLSELAQAVVQSLLLRERTVEQARRARALLEAELGGHVRALSAILDRLPLAVSVWDRELRNVYANAVIQQRFGRSAAALRGHHLSEVIGRVAYESHRAYHDAVLAGRPQTFDAKIPRADGVHDETVQLVPLLSANGGVEGYVSLVQDRVDALGIDAAQRALADSERKFRALSEASPLGVFHTDAAGLCTYTNARWQAIYGLTLDQSLGQGWSRTLHPDDRSAVSAQWLHCAASGSAFDMSFRVQRPDGSVRLVRALASALLDDAGAITGHVGTVEDVTEAHQAQTRLRDSEAALERTGTLAGVGGWEVDLVHERIYWSDQTCRIHEVALGHRPTMVEAIGYYAPEARDAVRQALAAAIASGAPFDFELPLVTARGRRLWVRAVGDVGYERGRAVRVVGAFQDVTWRRHAELALRDNNALLRELYERTPAMMHSIDTDGVLLSVSNLWLAKLGHSRERVIGRRSVEFFTEASQRVRAHELPRLWREGRLDRVPHQMVRSDGALVDVLLSAIAQLDAEGRPLRSLAVMEDVTEALARGAELQRVRREREQLEQHAQELDSLLGERSEMLNVLAHEVRQPLNNASAALQSAAAALADPQARSDALMRLVRAQGVMNAVLSGVDNTLAVASLLSTGSPAPPVEADVDIDTLIAVAIGDMPAGDRERVRIERIARTRTASMDMGLMRLALRNLLANALRHAAAPSAVVLRVTDSDAPLALVIDVIDQGPGIDPEVMPRLFERGARGRHGGTRGSHGLGLYIVRRALELQGGRAELVATGPGGTTMRMVVAQADGGTA